MRRYTTLWNIIISFGILKSNSYKVEGDAFEMRYDI